MKTKEGKKINTEEVESVRLIWNMTNTRAREFAFAMMVHMKDGKDHVVIFEQFSSGLSGSTSLPWDEVSTSQMHSVALLVASLLGMEEFKIDKKYEYGDTVEYRVLRG
ncbi:MAG: hypothetical protein ABIH21_02875 [Patescibacteria group bacterium]